MDGSIYITTTYGVIDGLSSYEFLSGGGSIHFHSILYVLEEVVRLREIPEDCIDTLDHEFILEFEPDSCPPPYSKIDLSLINTSVDIYNVFYNPTVKKNNTRPLGKRVCRLSVYYVHVKSKITIY